VARGEIGELPLISVTQAFVIHQTFARCRYPRFYVVSTKWM